MITVIFCGSTIISLIVAMIAIITRNWRYLIISAVLYSPLTLYLSATPRFTGAILLYMFHVLIAYSIHQRNRKLTWLAWVSLVTLILFPLWIIFLVSNQ